MFKRTHTTKAAKTGTTQATELGLELEQRIETETRRRIVDIHAAFNALDPDWQDRLESGAAFVMQAASIRYAIRNARHNGAVPQPPGLRFQVSALCLRDIHRYLIGDPQGRERLALISGTVSNDGVHVLSRMIDVAMDEASPAYVRAAPQATHKTIVQLVERDGHQLFGMFHSHIMKGAASTRPSGVDLANQERFAAMGWDEVIGGIFSLDGYIRLFSTVRDFSVSLYGNGIDIHIEHPREKIYKLTERA